MYKKKLTETCTDLQETLLIKKTHMKVYKKIVLVPVHRELSYSLQPYRLQKK